MTFDAAETSISDGRALRLYAFQRGPVRFYYTSADRDITFQSTLYQAVAISDEGNSETGESAQETFYINAPSDFEVARLFAVVPPSQKVLLTVYDLHDGDDDARLYWVGQVSTVSRPAGKVRLACESIVSAMQVLGLRLAWQRGCPHTVYDGECRADMEAVRVDTTLIAVTELTVTSPAFAAQPDGYFAGGFIQFEPTPGMVERRMIELHVGQVLTLLGSTYPLAPAAQVSAFPGCANNPASCDGVHHNLGNYGGIPGLPGKSPFENSPWV